MNTWALDLVQQLSTGTTRKQLAWAWPTIHGSAVILIGWLLVLLVIVALTVIVIVPVIVDLIVVIVVAVVVFFCFEGPTQLILHLFFWCCLATSVCHQSHESLSHLPTWCISCPAYIESDMSHIAYFWVWKLFLPQAMGAQPGRPANFLFFSRLVRGPVRNRGQTGNTKLKLKVENDYVQNVYSPRPHQSCTWM